MRSPTDLILLRGEKYSWDAHFSHFFATLLLCDFALKIPLGRIMQASHLHSGKFSGTHRFFKSG
jgi:hypothetical protein